jgi:hypothetical protein
MTWYRGVPNKFWTTSDLVMNMGAPYVEQILPKESVCYLVLISRFNYRYNGIVRVPCSFWHCLHSFLLLATSWHPITMHWLSSGAPRWTSQQMSTCSGVSALLMSPLSMWPRATAIHASFREVPPAMGRSPPSGVWPTVRFGENVALNFQSCASKTKAPAWIFKCSTRDNR